MTGPTAPRGLFEVMAEATSDTKLVKLLQDIGVSLEDNEDPRPPGKRPPAPIAPWREEQRAIAGAVAFMRQSFKWMEANQPRHRRPYRPADPGYEEVKGYLGEVDWADWKAREDDHAQRARALKVLATRVNAGLRRTVTLQIAPNLEGMKPVPRDVMGVCWLQIAEAAQAFVKQKPSKVCERPGCGVTFTPKRSTAKFCSTRCRLAVHLSAPR
jgi:hypothetical protein